MSDRLFDTPPEYVRTPNGWRRNPPAQEHSPTSVAAAESMRDHAPTAKQRVLDYIKAHGPVTDEMIAEGLGMNPSTVRPRRVELHRGGLIRPGGTCSTVSGRTAVMWGAA